VQAGEPIGPPVAVSVGADGRDRGDDDTADSGQFMQGGEKLGIGWTLGYYVLLFVGAYGFYKGSWRLTESSNALASFGEKR
jgi:prenyl protein peptidase